MKIKIATSIEQSKKLLELGLDADTADMWYLPIKDTYELVTTPSLTRGIIPAWSLSALLELIPQINLWKQKDLSFWTAEYKIDLYNKHLIHCDISLDATYSMLVFLLKYDFIKTK